MEGDRVRDASPINEGGFRGAGVDNHAVGVLLDYTMYLRKFYSLRETRQLHFFFNYHFCGSKFQYKRMEGSEEIPDQHLDQGERDS